MIHRGTPIKLWVELIKEGQTKANINLTENQESYTVFMLQRFLTRTDFGVVPFALQYLDSLLTAGIVERQGNLSDVADASLIMAGLFPERAKRLHVSSSYFMQMSTSCYLELANLCDYLKHKGEAAVYREVAGSVPKVASVLYSTRKQTIEDGFFSLQNVGVLH